MVEKKVTFEDSHGHRLIGILSDPSETKSRHIVVFCHGLNSSKASDTYARLQKELNSKGFATFRFDFYGHGESEGNFEEITTTEGKENALAALHYVKSAQYKHIGLMGSSFGGLCATLAASQFKELFALILRCPVSDIPALSWETYGVKSMNHWETKGKNELAEKGKSMHLNYSYVDDGKKNIAYDVAANVVAQTLILHGDQDTIVPIEQSKKLVTFMKHAELVVLPGVNHYFDNSLHFNNMIARVVSFFERERKAITS